MSGLDNPILLLEGENFGGNYGQILNIVQTNEPMPGYANQPIYFGSVVVGTYSVYALNMPQNYSGNNSELLKAYVVVIQVTNVPSGSTGINVTPMNIPTPEISTYGIHTNITGQLNIDIVNASSIQFDMPSSAPAIDGLIVIGF
jgi:hypothetical protein